MPMTFRPPVPFSHALADLTRGESVLLWTMRAWVADRMGGRKLAFPIEEILDGHDAGDAARPLVRMLEILGTSALEPVDMRCNRCLVVSRDEARVMSWVGEAQRGRPARALDDMRRMLPFAAARLALPAAAAIALAFAEARLTIPVRPASDAS